MSIDLYSTDILTENLFLPNRAECILREVTTYKIETKSGFFNPSVKCIFQCKPFALEDICITGVMQNLGVFNIDTYCRYNAEQFFNDDFFLYFNTNLPREILIKYPHIYKMVQSPVNRVTELPEMIFNGWRGSSDKYFYFRSKAIEDGKLNQFHCLDIITTSEFIARAVKEYRDFQKTRLFSLLTPNVNKIKQKIETGTSIFMIYKLAKLAFSLYSGSSFSDDGSPDIDVDFDSSSYDLSPQEMADYLCETDYDMNDNHSDVSFTGNGNKYTDNEYNRESADDFLEQEAYYRKKGDNAAADAAHRQAMKHKGRIDD